MFCFPHLFKDGFTSISVPQGVLLSNDMKALYMFAGTFYVVVGMLLRLCLFG